MATLHIQLDFPVPKGPLEPFNSTLCQQTAPTTRPRTQRIVHIGRPQLQIKNRPYFGIRGSKHHFECTKFSHKHPRLVVSTPQNCPNRHLDPVPRPSGLRQAARGDPKRWVPKWVDKVHRVKKKTTFFKKDRGPHGRPKQVFLARFELLVAPFGSPKIPKCLEHGLFCDKKWVKNVFFQK